MHVLVCVDDSEPAFKAIEFAKKLSCTLSIVHFVALNPKQSIPYLDHLERSYNMEIQDTAAQTASRIEEKLKKTMDREYKFHTVEGEGEIGLVIEDWVARNSVDLCVVGSRNFGTLKRFRN